MSESTAISVRPAAISGVGATETFGTASRQGSAAPKGWAGATAVWPRVAVVLLVLVALKLLLIAGQGQSLYEAHWRIGGVRVTRLNEIAFYGFVILGGLSLARLGRSCQSVGVASVRTANAVVFILGLTFIFLTFHNGDKNFIYPALSGVLKWTSVIPYLSNALFFNEPYLAGWIFAYVASYYLLARTGRETWVLWLTAGYGCTYGLVNLQELVGYRNELLIVDCVGVIALLMAGRTSGQEGLDGRRIPISWVWAPLAWTVFFAWALLRFDTEWHSAAATYFLGLIALTFTLFIASTLLIRRFGNPPVWSCLVAFFLVGFFLFTDSNYASSLNYNHLVCLGLTFPRYFTGELALAAVLGLSAWGYRRLLPRAGLWWLDFVCLGLIVVAGIDWRLSQIMGVRLGWDVLSFGDSPKMMLRLAKPYLPGVIAGLVGVGAVYALALRALRIWSERRSTGARTLLQAAAGEFPAGTADLAGTRGVGRSSLRDYSPTKGLIPTLQRWAIFACPSGTGMRPCFTTGLGRSNAGGVGPECPRAGGWGEGAFYVGVAFVALALLGLVTAESDKAEGQAALRLVQTSPLWKRVASRPMSREDFLKTAGALGLGDFARGRGVAAAGAPADMNVLVVFMESSYNKYLSLFGSDEETQPLLSKYKDRMELFPNFFSAFTGSIHARFATFTSLYPVQDFATFTQERVPVKSLFELLHERGYSCSMFYSSYFDYTGFRDFLKNRGLEEMYDADTMPGQRGTERVAWGLLEEETLGAIRSQIKKYAQNQQRFCLTYVPAAPHNPFDKIPKRFQKYKMEEVGNFKPVYLNELLYMDWVLASIVDELKESGLLDHTLVLITNDHGEMLGGKDGNIGHGWAVTPALANTPLIVMDPRRPGFQVNKTIGTQVDFLPTVLGRLNIPAPADQLYEGLPLDAGTDRDGRIGYLNSYKQFGIISGDQVLLGDRDVNDSSGVAALGKVYTISNEGAKTLFTEEAQRGTIQDRQTAMARFDSFQENLLRNYALYCRSIRGGRD
jgi:hypothetical protein